MITFCCLAEQVTLIRQTEAPDSNVTEAQAKEVRFVPLYLCTCKYSTHVADTKNFPILGLTLFFLMHVQLYMHHVNF